MTEFRKQLFVYLAGPITAKNGHAVEDNVARAVKLYWECLRRGIPAFCPQLSAAFPSAHSTVDYETWLNYDFAVIDRCTHILMLPRWQESTGAKREYDYARDKGIPVIFSLDELG